jgi:hypothetical protein
MLEMPGKTVKQPPLGPALSFGYNRQTHSAGVILLAEVSLGSPLHRFLETLAQLRTQHRRRIPFLAPPLERRRPRIAAEDYAARHSIEHTLDRKAELRRLAPTWPPAARRYHELLTYELDGLREVVAALPTVMGGRELEEALAEASIQIDRLEIEIAWCAEVLERAAPRVVMG